mgnify:CR=1 FL=1
MNVLPLSVSTPAIIGVDLGFKGGVVYARRESNGTTYRSIVSMPTVVEKKKKKTQYDTQYINDLIVSWSHLEHNGLLAVIEDVWARPGEGVVSSFRFGRGRGIFEGLLVALRIPQVYVAPVKWKRAMGLIGQDKNASRELAMKIAPEHASYFKRKKDDGVAEALLLAEYMHRTLETPTEEPTQTP